MRRPELTKQPDEEGFYQAARVNEVSQDNFFPLEINGRQILITKHQGRYFAFNASCPHASGNLAEGQLYKGRIDCPVHAYRFDVTTGTTLWPPDEPVRLKRYPTKLKGDYVLVKL